jgi:hypothetical protein
VLWGLEPGVSAAALACADVDNFLNVLLSRKSNTCTWFKKKSNNTEQFMVKIWSHFHFFFVLFLFSFGGFGI